MAANKPGFGFMPINIPNNLAEQMRGKFPAYGGGRPSFVTDRKKIPIDRGQGRVKEKIPGRDWQIPNDGRDPGVGPKDPNYFDPNGLPHTRERPGNASGGGGSDAPGGAWALPEGYSKMPGQGTHGAGWWDDRMGQLKSDPTFNDPSWAWGDDRWKNSYEHGDAVNVKADGNPNFGKEWVNDGWQTINPDDERVAAMFAESHAWRPEYQQGLREAWNTGNETQFQQWRDLGRANHASQWAIPDESQAAKPEQPTYSLPRTPDGKKKKPTPPAASVPTRQPDPWRVKESWIF